LLFTSNCLTINLAIRHCVRDLIGTHPRVDNDTSSSYWHRVSHCNAYGLHSTSRFASGLISPANVINPSDTACLDLDLQLTGEYHQRSHHLTHELADSSLSQIAILSAAHVVLRNRNLTLRCPSRQDLIGVVNNYAHCWRFFTSQLWRHNCIIIVDSASPIVVFTDWSTHGPSLILLRITLLTNMFTYFAGSCFAYKHPQGYFACTCLFQTCIIPAAKGKPLTLPPSLGPVTQR